MISPAILALVYAGTWITMMKIDEYKEKKKKKENENNDKSTYER